MYNNLKFLDYWKLIVDENLFSFERSVTLKNCSLKTEY